MIIKDAEELKYNLKKGYNNFDLIKPVLFKEVEELLPVKPEKSDLDKLVLYGKLFLRLNDNFKLHSDNGPALTCLDDEKITAEVFAQNGVFRDVRYPTIESRFFNAVPNDQAFGPHLALDLMGVTYDRLSSLDLHFKFLKEVPLAIGMTPITQPYVFPYSGLVPQDSGITGVTIIAESHLSVHSFEKKGFSFIDIFSCKPFDQEKVIGLVREHFDPVNMVIFKTLRGRGFSR